VNEMLEHLQLSRAKWQRTAAGLAAWKSKDVTPNQTLWDIEKFEGDTSYWNLDYRDNFYKYCCKWIIKDKVTVKKIKQDFKEGKENLVTADSKKQVTNDYLPHHTEAI